MLQTFPAPVTSSTSQNQIKIYKIMPIKRNFIVCSISLLRQIATISNPQISKVPTRSINILSDSRVYNSRISNFRGSRAFYCAESKNKCWNCGADAFLACQSCRSVQPVDPSVDYFNIFGLDRAYDIKVDNLESKYKDWQKKLHPDLVHTKSENEKTFAAAQSARVIDAYRTLSKPLSRALYLLQLDGVRVDEEQIVTDLDLLAEMMDLREAVEDASDSQALRQIESQIQLKLETWSDSFHKAFTKREYNNAIAATQRMRYYERAVEELVKKS